jgi:ABC-type transport system involved in cytochrome bd biosynthesis fused ATPase/permease subunit
MDESTSSLDIETEKEIIKEIKNLHGAKLLLIECLQFNIVIESIA